jgi:hypothetical protein
MPYENMSVPGDRESTLAAANGRRAGVDDRKQASEPGISQKPKRFRKYVGSRATESGVLRRETAGIAVFGHKPDAFKQTKPESYRKQSICTSILKPLGC